MANVYSDMQHIGETFLEYASENPSGRLHVVRADVVVDGIGIGEMHERNVIDRIDEVCTLSWNYVEDRTIFIPLKISFHENEIVGEFTFSGSPGGWTPLDELSEELSLIQKIIDEELDGGYPWFVELDTASMSTHGYDGGADREFTYESFVPMYVVDKSV